MQNSAAAVNFKTDAYTVTQIYLIMVE